MHHVHLQRAFTLVEVVVSIGIFLVIIGAVAVFEVNIFSYQRNSSGSFETVQDAEVIMKTITENIRMASPGSDGSYALQTVGTSTLMFYADMNGTGIKQRIRYTLIGSDLYQAVLTPTGSPLAYTGTEATTTILTDVVNSSSTPVFSYFDGTYAGTTTGALSQPVTPNAVRLVQVDLTLNIVANQIANARTYTADVTLRNLKDNL
jgi:prepilin-type N-terminal cleavage/methylation domain-containing protein